jgi:8-oxo-dGTP diphosphatase
MESSVAAIILRDGLVLVARRVFGGALGGKWEFPGGKLEEGETEAAALEREFDEEFGAKIQALRPLGETSFENRGKPRRLVAWLADLPTEEALELREHLSYLWVGREELEGLDIADSDRKLFPYIQKLF